MLGERKAILSYTCLPSRDSTHQQVNFTYPLVYDEPNLDEEVLREALGANLEFSSNWKSISVASLSPELRLLTMITCSNLNPLSSTSYMNLG